MTVGQKWMEWENNSSLAPRSHKTASQKHSITDNIKKLCSALISSIVAKVLCISKQSFIDFFDVPFAAENKCKFITKLSTYSRVLIENISPPVNSDFRFIQTTSSYRTAEVVLNRRRTVKRVDNTLAALAMLPRVVGDGFCSENSTQQE